MLARLLTFRSLAMLLCTAPAIMYPSLRTAHAAGAEAEDASDEGGEGTEEDPKAPDPTQPILAAGGNYDIEHIPLNEVMRTLLIPEKALELELHYDFDIQAKACSSCPSESFKTHTFTILGRYGVGPTTNVVGGFMFDAAVPDGADKEYDVAAGIDQAIVYDILDVRAGIQLSFVSPAMGDSQNYVDFFVGLPVKYRFSDKIAFIGLERILVIKAKKPDGADGTPDLIFSIAGEANPIDQLAVILRVSLNLTAADFDQRRLPVELDVQYSLNRQFDIGLEIIAKNIAPPSLKGMPMVSAAGALDNVGMGLFVKGRM